MAIMNTSEFLKEKVDLLKDFSNDTLQKLVSGARVESFEKNQAVAHAGDEVLHFSVVLSGSIDASIPSNGGNRQGLGRLGEGGTFGEMALMTGERLAADFIAESPSKVLRIPVYLFKSK